MPRTDQIPESKYTGDQPYHFHFDNLPITAILQRIEVVNAQVDVDAAILRQAAGTAGSLQNRLNQSLLPGGGLDPNAVNTANHSIAYHEDGSRPDGPGNAVVEYVRMKKTERDKLELIDDEANKLEVLVKAESGDVLFEDGTIVVEESDTITWTFTGPNKVKAETVFPASAARLHYYDVTPDHANLSTPDFKNYVLPSSAIFLAGSLRVYVNGIKLSATDDTFVYIGGDPAANWVALRVASQTPASGTFVLNVAVSADDVVRVDFDALAS